MAASRARATSRPPRLHCTALPLYRPQYLVAINLFSSVMILLLYTENFDNTW